MKSFFLFLYFSIIPFIVNNINTGTRIGTMLLDHMAMCFVAMIFVAPGMIYDITQSFGNPGAPPKLMMGNIYMNVLGFSLYFNKDIFHGRSLAKRALKLQVIDVKTNKAASPLKCFARNLTIILWPIEVIAALINNERRIGDYIAGTKLVPYAPDQNKEQLNWGLIGIALAVGMVFTWLVMFLPFQILEQSLQR